MNDMEYMRLALQLAEKGEVFFHYIQTRRPFVAMKYAMTLDGKIAAYTGASLWITGEAARNHIHTLRDRYSAIMAGVGTVLADDPLLTCRIPGGKHPVRIICDTRLRTPLTTAKMTPTILAACCTDKKRHLAYETAGCRILFHSFSEAMQFCADSAIPEA